MNSTRTRIREDMFNNAYAETLASCKQAYDAKEYVKTVEIVDSVMRVNDKIRQPNDKTELLDLKCLSYVKLDDLDKALETAKAMVRLNKGAGIGYCRIASIEKARSNIATAVQFLDHGYSRVAKTDKYFEHLQSQRAKLRELAAQNIVMSKAKDPMTVLPLELIEFVLSYLDYKQIVAVLRVCKSWKRILCRLEPIFNTVDFRKSFKQISYPELRAALQRLGRPKTLAIDKLSTSAGDVLSKKLFQGPIWLSLEHLIVNDKKISIAAAPFADLRLQTIHLGLDTRISMNDILKILAQCRGLKEAVFRRVTGSATEEIAPHDHLEVFELGNPFDLAAFPIQPEHFSKYPNLKSLVVNGASSSSRTSWDLRCNTQLIKLDTYACVIRTINLPGSLEQWLWDGTEVPCFNLSSMMETPPTPLPNLHTICLSGDNAFNALTFLQASEVKPGQLRRVGLHNRQNGDTWTRSVKILELLASVEDFSFESESLLDEHFAGFAARYPQVVTLQLAAPRITGAFIADLLRRPDNSIRKLILKDCEKVPRDAVEWARSQGVKVEVHVAHVQVRGGRRLREGWF